MNHTPTPWHRNIRPVTKYPIVFAGNAPAHEYCFSFHVPREVSAEQAEANLDFLLRACNAHEALVAALEIGISAYAGSRENWEKMKETLKLAKGE